MPLPSMYRTNPTGEDTRLTNYNKAVSALPPAPKDEQGLGADLVDKFQEGFYNTTGGIGTGVRGMFTDTQEPWKWEESQYRAAQDQSKTLSTAQKEADRKMGFDSEDEITGRGVAGIVSSGLGSLLPSMVGGGVPGAVLKGGAKALGLGGTAQKVAQGVGYGAGGAVQIGGATKNEVEKEIARMKPEQLKTMPDYNALIDSGLSPVQAQKQFAYDQSQKGLTQGGVLGAISMGTLGPVLERIVMGNLGKTAVQKILGGAATEGTQEFIEEGGQARIGNPLVGKPDWENVVERGGLGAIGGMGAGGVVGGVGAMLQPGQRSPEDLPIVDDQDNVIGYRDQNGQAYSNFGIDNTGLPMSDIGGEVKGLPSPANMGHAPVPVPGSTFGGPGFEQQTELPSSVRNPTNNKVVPDTGSLSDALNASVDSLVVPTPANDIMPTPIGQNGWGEDIYQDEQGKFTIDQEGNAINDDGSKVFKIIGQNPELDELNKNQKLLDLGVENNLISPEDAHIANQHIEQLRKQIIEQEAQAPTAPAIEAQAPAAPAIEAQAPAAPAIEAQAPAAPAIEEYQNRVGQQNKLDRKAVPVGPFDQVPEVIGKNDKGEQIYQDENGKRFIQGVPGAKGNNKQYEMENFRGSRFKIPGEVDNDKITTGTQVTYQNRGKPVSGTITNITDDGVATIKVDGYKRPVKRPVKNLTASVDAQETVSPSPVENITSEQLINLLNEVNPGNGMVQVPVTDTKGKGYISPEQRNLEPTNPPWYTKRGLTYKSVQDIIKKLQNGVTKFTQPQQNVLDAVNDYINKGDEQARIEAEADKTTPFTPTTTEEQVGFDDFMDDKPALTPDQVPALNKAEQAIDKKIDEVAAKLAAKLKANRGTLSSGVDPEILLLGAELGTLYIGKGAVKFAQYSKVIIDKLSNYGIKPAEITPALKQMYLASQANVTDEQLDTMDDIKTVRAFDLNTLTTEEIKNVPGTATGVEPDRTTTNENTEMEATVQGKPGTDRQSPAGTGQGNELEQIGDRNIPITRTPPGRKGSNTDIRGQEPTDVKRTTGNTKRGRTDRNGETGQQRDTEQEPREVIKGSPLAKELPLLYPEQLADVEFAEKRLKDNQGVMFTNGTGTGKTFSGMGIIKRFANKGKTNTLIVVPGENVLQSWIDAGKLHDLDVTPLKGISDGGTGIVVTTYANLGQNNELVNRNFDLIVTDESHKLMENAAGKPTSSLDKFRALTGHKSGNYPYAYAKESDLVNEITTLRNEIKEKSGSLEDNTHLDKKLTELQKKLANQVVIHSENRQKHWKDKKTKTVFLSATPFAYVKNTVYGEGFLFDFPKVEESGAYNAPDPREAFFIENFGYRMRFGKLTEPEAGVESDLMEREFNETLKKSGAVSGRRLLVDKDYSREFVLVDDAIGNKIDEGFNWIHEQSRNDLLSDNLHIGYNDLWEALNKQFTYHERIRLLEAIKAKHAVPRIKEHLKLGRKVVVFHSRIQGGSIDPFQKPATDDDLIIKAYKDFTGKRPDLLSLDLKGLVDPITLMQNEFKDNITFYNGTINKKDKKNNPDKFNLDNSDIKIIMVQDDAGKEGISLHDTTGNNQRVQINLGLPVKPTQSIQIEGRTYRVGQASDAPFEYFNTGTSFERIAFATRIAERASTAENLALGNESRGLKESFIDKFENPNTDAPSVNQGKGGKDEDFRDQTTTPFEKAKTYYFGVQKNTKTRVNREGADYFATPEPLGLKMVEWANIGKNDRVLEPSAGHGAIARFFPELSNKTVIEPSNTLASKLALRTDGKLITSNFEDHNIINKYDAIVMNPPYGLGGSTSTKHVAKAIKHLRDGGRIVALLPDGPAANKKLDKLLEETTDIHLLRTFGMPTVTFTRAGTGVKTQVVILEKQTNDDIAPNPMGKKEINAETINDFFDSIENIDVQARVKPEPVITPKTVPDTDDQAFTIAKGYHTKKQKDIWKVEQRIFLDKATWAKYKDIVSEHNGYFSKFGKATGVKGNWIFDTEEDAKSFKAAISPKYSKTPDVSVSAFAKQLENDLDLKSLSIFKSGNDLKINTIIVDKSQRKQGKGTEAVIRIVEYADNNGLRVVLSPAIKDDYQGTTSRARLVRFYKRFGFKENKGRNKDFTLSESMFRPVPPKYSKPTADKPTGQTAEGLKNILGKTTDNVVIVGKQSELPGYIQDNNAIISGAYDPTSGKMYLVAENIAVDDSKQLLNHEVVHGVLRQSPAYKFALEALKRVKNTKAYKDAEQTAIAAGTPAEDMQEEILAYYIQHYPKAPIVTRLISSIRQWLRKHFGIGNLTMVEVADMVNSMARGDIKREYVLENGTVMFHAVFHGTPHEVDKFTTERIGTGEGNQAQGWGLYFADDRGIAEHYRNKLTEETVLLDGKVFETGIHQVYKSIINNIGNEKEMLKSLNRIKLISWEKEGYQHYVDQAIDAIKNGSKFTEGKGNIYGIDLKPTQDEYLYWDKPLSKQSQHVKNAIIAMGMGSSIDEYTTGQKFYQQLQDFYEPAPDANFMVNKGEAQKQASLELLNNGIRGNKYLSAVGRTTGEQYNYVIFSDDDVEITAKYSRRVVTGTNTSWRNEEGFQGLDNATLEATQKFGKPPSQGIVADFKEKADEYRYRWATKLKQGIVDQFVSFKDILKDPDTYMKASLSGTSHGAIEKLITTGQLYLDKSGAVGLDTGKKSLAEVLKPLKKESDRFLMWAAANRADQLNKTSLANQAEADRLTAEARILEKQANDWINGNITVAGRTDINNMKAEAKALRSEAKAFAKKAEVKERLLTQENINKLKMMNKNDAIWNNRKQVYAEALKNLNELQHSITKIGVQTGLTSKENAAIWEAQSFYIPFNRLADDMENTKGANFTSGLTSQKDYEKLKGANIQLDDLLGNIIMNFNHIIDASLKNQAGVSALETAEDMGLASKIPEAVAGKNSVFVKKNGKKQFYDIVDTQDGNLVRDSLISMNYDGLNGTTMKIMRKFKRALTIGVTASPEFKVANLMRDSLAAIAVTDMSTNIAKNIVNGYKLTAKDNPVISQMIVGGGAFPDSGFAHGSDPDLIKHSLKKGVENSHILDNRSKIKKMWDVYQDFGARLENINRAANFEKNMSEGMSLLEANFNSRDHLDFQKTGSFVVIRAIAQTVPFFNARLQGLYKLGRAGMDTKQRKQFMAVVGTYAIASVLLYLSMKDDEDYKEAKQWERDTYHLFKIPGDPSNTMYRFPRPFEMGAIASMIERAAEQIVDDDVHGALFGERLLHALGETFAMNPVPQLFKPMVEVWANRNTFTKSPIESVSMQNLSPTERRKIWTTETAIGASELMDTVSWGNVTLSPVQIDHLIRGYLGWMGGFVTESADMILKPAMDRPAKASARIEDYLLVGRFAREGEVRSSKYITQFYDNLKEINTVFADIKLYRENQDYKAVNDLIKESTDKIVNRKFFNQTRNKLSKINIQIRLVNKNRNLSPDKKRKQLDRLYKMRNAYAKQAVDQLK